VLTAERPCVPRQPDGHACGSPAIAALDVQAIRAFATIEHRIGGIEPPRRQRQTLARLRAFARAQRRFKRGASLAPLAVGEKFISDGAVGGPFGPHCSCELYGPLVEGVSFEVVWPLHD